MVMVFENKYGSFSENGKEFIINQPKTPRHWYNYMWNDKLYRILITGWLLVEFCAG